MKIAIFSDLQQKLHLESLISGLGLPGVEPRYIHYPTYDDLIAELPESGCDLTIIASGGASGMESARAVKILLPHIPLIWLSDDKAFGPESFRLGCSFFSAAPITKELLKSAFHCTAQQMRIQ